MPDRDDYFRCPLCRGVACERVVVRRPNGSSYITQFYSCSICTIMFLDPLAFTRGFEDRPQSGPRSTTQAAHRAWAKINQARKDRK